MKTKIYRHLLLAAVLGSSVAAVADVYTWRDHSGSTSYSDAPRNLQIGRTGTVNVRTHKVSTPKPQQVKETLSPAEQAEKANRQINEDNKKVEEQNRKIAEENQQRKDDNCKAAQLNLQFANSARSNNRQSLINHYEADIQKYCR